MIEECCSCCRTTSGDMRYSFYADPTSFAESIASTIANALGGISTIDGRARCLSAVVAYPGLDADSSGRAGSRLSQSATRRIGVE